MLKACRELTLNKRQSKTLIKTPLAILVSGSWLRLG